MSVEMDRWQEIKQIVQDALALPLAQRSTHLDQVCKGDEELRTAVESLLAVTETRAEAFDDLAFAPSGPRITLAAGDRFEDWLIVRELPGGGMSWVYLAEEPALSRRVVLKFVRPHAAQISAHEHEILGRFQDEGIASVYATGRTAEGIRYIVMEYVDGEPITAFCDQEGLSLRERLSLFRRVCAAVQTAHQKGIIHRDLKPNNILVITGRRPKILDFGIAMRLDVETPSEPSGPRPATIAYSSPEQLAGEPTDARTDVYSLGVLLCELLTGKLPYQASTPLELSLAIRAGDPSSSSGLVEDHQVAKTLRGDLDAIVGKVLRKSASDRYPSVEAFGEDIARFLKNEPVHARERTRLYRANRFLRRNRTPTSVAVLVLLALIASLVLVVQENKETARERDRAHSEAAQAAQLADYLVGLFENSDPWQTTSSVNSIAELLNRSASELETSLAEQPQLKTRLLTALSTVLINRGNYDRAQSLLERASELATPSSNSSFGHASTFLQLGRLHFRRGEYELAKSLLQEGLASLHEEDQLEKHSEVQLHRELAAVATETGDYDEALRHFRLGIGMARGQQPEMAEELAGLLRGLATLLALSGESKAAQQGYEESLALRIDLFGPNHPQVAEVQTGLAVLLHQNGNYADAEKLFRRQLAILEATFDRSHPKISEALHNIASCRDAVGDSNSATPLYRKAVALRREFLGSEHPELAQSLNNLAGSLAKRGDYGGARPLFEESLEIRRKTLPEQHQSLAESFNNLGFVEHNLGHFGRAESLYRNAAEIFKAVLGENNTKFVSTLRNIGFAAASRGNLEEAERVYRRCLEIEEDSGRGPTSSTVVTLNNLASLLADQGRYDESLVYFDRGLSAAQAAFAGEHWLIGKLLANKANALIGAGQSASAKPLAEKALNMQRGLLPSNHPDVAHAESVLGGCLVSLGKYKEAELLLADSFEILLAAKGEASAVVRKAAMRSVQLYEALEDGESASRYRVFLSQ